MAYQSIIGRKEEIKKLENLLKSPKSEFVAIYERELENKIDAFLHSKQHTKTHSIQLVMVTTNGVTKNAHAKDVNQSIILDDLF